MSTEVETPTDLQQTPRLLPLDLPRTIRLTSGKRSLDFTFQRIEQKAWRQFLESVITRVEQHGAERIRMIDEESALLELFARTISGVSGYSGMDGLSQSVATTRVPVRHQIAAATVLRSIGTAISTEPMLSEFEEVTLEVPWSVNSEGQMEMFTGLVHRFKQPTVDQFRRFRLGCARVVVTGDAEDGVTTYPSRLAVALGLYDELIAEVDGYMMNGIPIADADTAAREMDAIHKARAVLELFDRSDEDLSVGTAKATNGASETE